MTKKGIFSFFLSMFFMLMMANPALTNEEPVPVTVKVICIGQGEWAPAANPSVVLGKTAFSLRANFPGNASGGQVYVSMNTGSFFLIDVAPDYSFIYYGDWQVTGVVDPVEGYAFWGIGPVIATNDGGAEGMWALVGAYDGSESDESDYLLAFPYLTFDQAEDYLDVLVGGEVPYHQFGPYLIPLTLQVELVKGNATINVIEEEP